MSGLGIGVAPLGDWNRPSMQQDQHEAHNMPAPEHNGREHTDARSMLEDRNRTTTYSGFGDDGQEYSTSSRK